MAEVMTTSEVAEQLGTDPKTLRKFFRSDQCSIEPVGQGKRYAITKADIKELKTAFGAWSSGKAKKAADVDDAEPKADKVKKPAKARAKKEAKADPEDEVIEDLDSAEPTADELEDLDDALEDLDLD